MGAGVLDGLPGKNHGKFFAAKAERFAAALDPREMGGHHAQNLVTDVVPVAIIHFLKMVNIDHGQRVAATEAARLLP